MRDVAISSLATFVSTSFDEDHELLLTDATCKLFGQPACKSTESKLFGLPRKAIHALKLGGGVSGLGDAAAGSVDASAIAPTPYVSPAFEVRVSVLHALRVIGQTSPSCRDAALLMMMMAHGPDASRSLPPGPTPRAPKAEDEDDPPPRAPLRLVADASVRSIAMEVGQSMEGLLRRRAQQLLAMWLQLDLKLPRLPSGLFGVVASSADEALRAFVWQNRTPLTIAAAMASNSNVLSNAAQVVGFAGGAADLLLEALPHVLAQLISMQGSDDDAERESYTRGMEFVSRQLSPRPLLACTTPKLPELITELLMCATTAEPQHPPKRSISHLLSVLVASPDSRGASAVVASEAALAHTLRNNMPPLRITKLILHLREALASGEAELAAFELLMHEKMLTPTQLGEGCTPHLVQAALLQVAAHSRDPAHPHACLLLERLHDRLGAMPSVRAALLPALLRVLLPIAPRSAPAQKLLHALFAVQNDEASGGVPPVITAALRSVAPYELLIPDNVHGLRELHMQLCEIRGEEPSSVADELLACESAAPAHLLGVYPALNDRGDDLGAGRADSSDLEARAAVARVIAILGEPSAFEDPSLAKWLEHGKEEEEEEEQSSRGAGMNGTQTGETGLKEDDARARSIDEDTAIESGGESWCAWNDPAFPRASDYEPRSPLERLRRWLLRLAAAPGLSKQLAELIAQALGLCALPYKPHVRLHRALAPAASHNAQPPAASTKAVNSSSRRHVRLLRQVHAILISAEAPSFLCSIAARVLFTIMMSRDSPSRTAATSALEGIERLSQPHAAAVYHHLEAFKAAPEMAANGSGGFFSPRTVSPSAKARAGPGTPTAAALPLNATLVCNATVWAANASGRYDHSRWLSSVVAPLLEAATDPLLAACAPLAASAPRFAASLLDEALVDVASQATYGAALAAAVHAALKPTAGACPAQKSATILRACAALLCARNCPDSPTGGSATGPADPFWSTLDLLSLAEMAAAQRMHHTALYLLEGHHARSSAFGSIPRQPALGPAPPSSADNAIRARQMALLRRTLPHLPHKDAADGIYSLEDVTATDGVQTDRLELLVPGGKWLSRSLALAMADVEMRSHGDQPPTDAAAMAAGVAAASQPAESLASSGRVNHGLGSALEELRSLGCFALMHSLSAPAGGGDGRLSEMHCEVVWRLGMWQGVGGRDAEGIATWRDGSCHAALASALPLVGSGSDGAFASLRDDLGRAQQRLLLQARETHPEATTDLVSMVSRLQLCGTLRELSGALLDDLPKSFDTPIGWLLSRAVVQHAKRYGSRQAEQMDAGESVGSDVGHDATDRDALTEWLQCQNQRLEQQHKALSLSEFKHQEPLVALHLAVLRQMQPGSHAEQLDLVVQAVQRAQLLGDLDSARALIRQAAEMCNALRSASGSNGDGSGSSYCSATWACRWEDAKLLWAAGGEHCSDAMLVAKRLLEELQLATQAGGGAGSGSSMGARGSGALSRAHEQLHWELLRELGGWMDTLRCESRGQIESEMLDRAVKLAESSGDSAVADALFALARFHERQFVSLRNEAQSSSFAKLVSVKARTAHELRRTQHELHHLGEAASKSRRRALEVHERELRIMLQRDELESSGEHEHAEHLKLALDNYLLCLRRTTRNSETSRAAASAVVRLWTRNRDHAHLSTHIEEELRTGLSGKIDDFVPLSFQLTSRLNSATDTNVDPLACLEESLSQSQGDTAGGPHGTQLDDDDMGGGGGGGTGGGGSYTSVAAAAFQQALSALILEVSERDEQQLVLHQLLAELPDGYSASGEEDSGAAGASGDGVDGTAVQGGRRHAAMSLLKQIRARADDPAAIDAIIALNQALRHLAHCPNPPGTPGSGGRIAIADALTASGIDAKHDVSRLHELGHSLNTLNVPPAIPSAFSEGNYMSHYLPSYIALPSGVPASVASARPAHANDAKLVWVEDENGTRHALLLKAGAPGTLDTRRDALVQQFVEELNEQLHSQPNARLRGLKMRGRRVLPLSPSAGMYEWRGHAVGVHSFLASEHAKAYGEGRESLDLAKFEQEIIAAHAKDAESRDRLASSTADARAPVSGAVAAASSAPSIGGEIRTAWRRGRGGTAPLLHLFLLRCSPSPEAWLVRRFHLSRSLATSSMAGWLLGLGERAPHRILLDQATAEAMHVGTQAILLQRPAEHAAATSGPVLSQVGAPPAPPFRLTRELVDALGPAGVDGPFRCAAEVCLQTAQGEQASAALLTLLEVFVDEPMVGWAAASEGAAVPWAASGSEAHALAARLDAEVAVLHAQKRLLASGGETTGAHAAPLSVESRVRQLISQATSEDVLASQPPRWRAWL